MDELTAISCFGRQVVASASRSGWGRLSPQRLEGSGMSELADRTATDLVAGYRAGEVSPVEVLDSVLERVESCEPKLCATYALDPEAARTAERDSAQRWRNGTPARPLDGCSETLPEHLQSR